MSENFIVPDGWQVSGDLFNDKFMLLSSSDSIIDVSWIPEGNPDGHYVCRWIGNTFHYLETESVEEAAQWIRDAIS